jgi:hypothetical protein
MNYSELKTNIQNYIETSEASFVSSLDTFIKSSEDTIFAAIEGPMFWKASTATDMVDGTFEYTLVDGSTDVLGIRLDETVPGDMSTGGPFRYLLRKDVDFLFEAYPGSVSGLTKGIPKYYAVTSAQNNAGEPTLTIRIGPTSDAAYKTEVEYYGKAVADSITDGGDSKATWLSVTYPSVLLYGALVDAYIFQKGEADVIAYYKEAFDTGISLIKNMSEKRQTTDTYSDRGTEEAR